MIIITPASIRRIALVVSVTGFMIALTGSIIYASIWDLSPYAAYVGFAIYSIIAFIAAVMKMVRITNYETNLEEIHTLAADTNQKLDELFEYVRRND